MQEIEIKFLNVDPAALEWKILQLGGSKVSNILFEEWIFKKPDWKATNGRVRLRKSESKIFVSYKETTQSTASGNTEIEFEVSDSAAATEFIKKLDVPLVRHQQKRRIHFELKGASIDIDFWPKIPPYVEIEAESEPLISSIAMQLGFDISQSVGLDAAEIYKQKYNIDVEEIKELVF